MAPLNDQAPLYHRPTTRDAASRRRSIRRKVEDRVGLTAALWKLIACPDLCSRAWVWDQYDSTVGGQTVKRPGAADAAVVKLEGLSRALALTTDCTPRYCAADPEAGGMQAVAEAWRNLTAVGARPLALTDNMNFGNPERPEIMGQFAAAIRGMAAACEALDFPVVSGNVSLYNETRDPSGVARAILPTPAIGGLGVLDDAAQAVGIALGPWLDVVRGRRDQGLARPVAVAARDRRPRGRRAAAGRPGGRTRRRAISCAAQILAGNVRACHDVSDGGILVAVAEMAMAGDDRRAGCSPGRARSPATPIWFGEDQGRYVLAVPDAGAFIRSAEAAGLPAVRIGTSGGQDLTLPDGGTISVRALRAAHERFFPVLDGGRPAWRWRRTRSRR